MIPELDRTTIDWSNFERAGNQARALLKSIIADKSAFRELIHRVEEDENLMGKCERHQLLDYLVIYDALDRGFRLRLHRTTSDSLDRPHDHRFSFSSIILHGEYQHTLHELKRPIYDSSQDELCRSWQNKINPDPESKIEIEDALPSLTRTERQGSCYSLHHSVVHALRTKPNTISLVLRGPAEKRRSIIMDSATQTFWWRYGQSDETPERRKEKQMSLADYRVFRDRLASLGVIEA